jgi:ABC-type Zn uptake system ZnuABC Zn-binding protein ZnuA
VLLGPAIALLGLIAAIGVSGCSTKSTADPWPADRPGPRVLVSFAPYYCFAANVAGDDAVVLSLMSTSGPHHFQPTDRDAKLVQKADLFFINGLGLDEEQAETLKRGTSNQKLKIVELGERIPEDKLLEGSCSHDHADGAHKHEHGKDPHIWLSPEYAVTLVESIRDELKSADPGHAANYDRRATEYISRLKKLQAEGEALLKDKKDRRMVSFHESMAYFAKTFNLDVVGVIETTPGSEPDSKNMKRLIALCDGEHPIRLLTVEPQYSTSNAGEEVLKLLKQKKVPDPVLVEFDTLETVVPEQLKPDWYETKMRANLHALAEKMK